MRLKTKGRAGDTGKEIGEPRRADAENATAE